MSETKVLMAFPNTGWVCTGIAKWLLAAPEWAKEKNIEMDTIFSSNRPIPHNRNQIAKYFMDNDHEWLISIDADITPPDNLFDIIHPDRKLVAAHACSYNIKKNMAWPVAFKKDAGSPTGYLRADNLQPNTPNKVDAFGTGCYAVHRDVFEALEKPWYKDVFTEDGMDKVMGEDIFFTTQARKAGFQPYYDTRCIAKHLVEASV